MRNEETIVAITEITCGGNISVSYTHLDVYKRQMLNICIVFAQLERETIQKRVTDAYYSRCLKGDVYKRQIHNGTGVTVY